MEDHDDADMDQEDFLPDFGVPEEVASEEGEASRFHAAEKARLAQVEEETVIPNLVEEIAVADEKFWIGILMIHKDDARRPLMANVKYSAEWVYETLTTIYPGSEYHAPFKNMEVGLLGRACATAISNCTYTNDGGKAHHAMQAKAVCRDGLWCVDNVPRNKQVIPITSQHAVDVQLFCCSVALSSFRSVEYRDKKPCNISVPVLIEKNVAQKETLPVEVKRVFLGLLQLNPKLPVNATTIAKAPFLWKSIYETVKETSIPLDSLPMPLVYFKWVNKNFGYTPKTCKLDDVYYATYPPVLKELSHTVAAHSVMVGGVFVNSHHFENEGLKHSSCKHVGGEFATRLCDYNTNRGVIWEAAGAAIESPTSGLETVIASVKNATQFEGLWWNPRGQPEYYEKAKGFIIPYDKNGKGLHWVKAWVALERNIYSHVRVWCHYGSMPALWIEHVAADEPYAHLFNPHAADILWKSMGVMAIYNMQASLNSNWALSHSKGNSPKAEALKKTLRSKFVPCDPVFCAVVNGNLAYHYTGKEVRGETLVEYTDAVPSIVTDYCTPNWLPGRWNVNGSASKETETLKRGFGAYNNYASRAKGAYDGFSGTTEVPAGEDTLRFARNDEGVFDRSTYKKPKRD